MSFSLQNKLLLSVLRGLFDNSRKHDVSLHDGYYGVKASENGQFLYKSTQGDEHVR